MQFLNPGILWALLALGIPVIIHLFNFQRTEKILFSNTRLLTEVMQQTQKARQLKNLLLLLIRILALALLILAFAQPTFRKEQEISSGDLPEVCTYLDNSGSVFFSEDGDRAFEKAQAYSNGIPSAFSNHGWFQLITNDFLSRHNWTSSQGFKDQVLEVEESKESRNLETVLERCKRQFRLKGGSGEKHIYILSDFQKSQVGNLSGILLDSTINFHFRPLQHSAIGNVWIDSVWLPKPLSGENIENEISVSINNSGLLKEKNINLQLYSNKSLLSGKLIRVVPNSKTTSRITFRINSNNNMNCTLVLDDQEGRFDNSFYLNLNAPKPIDIHLLTDKSQTLIPGIFKDKRLFNFSKSSISSPDYPKVDLADFLILEDPEKAGETLKESIFTKLKDGKRILIIPGKSNGFVKAIGNDFGFSLENKNLELKSSNWKIEMPDKSNSFFKGVFREDIQGTYKPTSQPAITLNGGQYLLKYESGAPFLSKVKTSNGQFYFLASEISEEAGSFFKHPLIIPSFYKMAFSGESSKVENLYLRPDQKEIVLRMDSSFENGESSVELVSEGTKILATLVKTNKQAVLQLPQESLKPGFWSVMGNGKKMAELAVNPSSTESRTDFYSEGDLKEIFPEKPWIEISEISVKDSTEHLKNKKDNDVSLWKYCIWFALLLFIVEMILVRFGKQNAIG